MASRLRRIFHFGLPFIGDFNNSTLTIVFILFGVQIGLSPSQIGWIVTSYGIAYLISSPLIGLLGDRLSRKTSILIATIGQTVIAGVYLFVYLQKEDVSHYLYLIIIGQVIRAILYAFYWPAIEAHLSESSGDSMQQHQRSIGHFCIAWSLGAALGSNLGGVFADIQIELALIVVIVVYVLGIILAITTMDHHPVHSSPIIIQENHVKSNGKHPNSNSKSSSNDILRKISAILLMGTFLFAISCNGIMNYFSNYASLPAGLHLTEIIIGQLLFIFGMGRFIAFLLQEKIPITLSFLIFSSACEGFLIILYGIFKNPIILGSILFVSGFLAGRVYYNSLELTLKYQKQDKGAKAGIFESVVGLGSAVTPILSGHLAELNLSLPFYIFGTICLVMAGISTLLLKLIKKAQKKHHESSTDTAASSIV